MTVWRYLPVSGAASNWKPSKAQVNTPTSPSSSNPVKRLNLIASSFGAAVTQYKRAREKTTRFIFFLLAAAPQPREWIHCLSVRAFSILVLRINTMPSADFLRRIIGHHWRISF